MNLKICDGADCRQAVAYESEYDLLNKVGWTRTEYVVEAHRAETVELPRLPPEPEVVHGEVEMDGKKLPFVLHKPKEIEDHEKAMEVWAEGKRERPPEVRRESAFLCPRCSPKLPALKPRPEPR